MKIAVFGASGKIGRLFVQQAIDEGHSVNVYTRTTPNIPVSDKVMVFVGELSDTDKIRRAVKGTDAVVSLLGPPLKRTYPGMPIAEGHRNIVAALEAESINRFITIATPSIKFHRDKTSIATVLPGILARLFFPKPYKEIVEVGEIVKSTDLQWTIVRFIAPVDRIRTASTKVTFGEGKIKFAISRQAIAAFILKELSENRYLGSMPIIGS